MKTNLETLEAKRTGTKTTRLSLVERIGLVTGLITSLALTGYFLLMKVLGLAQILELRYFNALILAAGIAYGIRRLKRSLPKEDFYLKGWGQGFFIAVVAIVPFALFVSLYLVYLDPELFQFIREHTNAWQPLNGVSIFISLLMEGLASAIIITFASMQYFKRNGVSKEEVTE